MLAVALMFRNGWEVRKNQIIDYRSAEGHAERLPPLAADLVALKPDLLISTQ
jgi:putative ABC transport system substrate-binding protein